ncbi:MAG: YdcF family protein [Dactylosporangium sp.]|nr:YdcF family protein [Dactylosporangium sp.]NNJ61928.1 YdcF family protein [Dactylosporangium sp.]
MAPETTSPRATVPTEYRHDVEILWDYHDMHHELRPCDLGIGLGSHDPGVAMCATELFHAGMFPRIVFTGANAPTTIGRFPRGEAVHYREHAIEHGVPADAILIETAATNTGQNFDYTRRLIDDQGISIASAIVISRPYQQRRAYATCKKLWPELDILCASHALTLDDYVTMINDVNRVINMLVGDTQRIEVYAEQGFAIPQDMPDQVRDAYQRLAKAGFTSRLV